jgi:hypothetical protein
MKASILVLVSLLSVFCLQQMIFPQSTAATLSGVVMDESGAVVPGAVVVILNPATGAQRQVTTSNEGYFVFPLLAPGNYTITAQHDGFSPVELRNVILNVNDQRSLQIQLKVGRASQTVTVIENASLIQNSATVGTVVDRQFVENMPLNGRSFQSLLELTPGVTFVKVDTSAVAGGQFSVNGQRADGNYFTVDGVGANYGMAVGFASFSGQSNGGTLPALTVQGGTNSLVSIDALQEFQIQTSTYAPEFGRMPGGQVSLSTRSGTNAFHGDVFEYLRNNVLDARSWFENYNNLNKAEERQNDFGGVIGGPIYKNKTFFFFSYEGLRLRQPVTGTAVVPDIASRNAVAAVSPAEAVFINAYPRPNGPEVSADLANYNASVSSPSTLNAYSIRIDHALTDKVTLFGHFTHSPSSTGSYSEGYTTDFNNMLQLTDDNNSATLGATWVISNSMVNEVRANYSQLRASSSGQVSSYGGAVAIPNSNTILYPAGFNPNTYMTLATVVNGYVEGDGYTIGTGNENWNRQVNVTDTFSWTKGAHQLKFGLDYLWHSPILNRAGGNFQEFVFDLSNPGSLLELQYALGGVETIPIFHNYSAFAQDTWKVTPRLTLMYGVRWDANPSPSWRSGSAPSVLSSFSQTATGASAATLLPYGTPIYKSTWLNFGPRVGVAYSLRQSSGHETVLRGGYGIFYDTGVGTVAGNVFDHIYPHFASVGYGEVPFSSITSLAQPVLGVSPPQQFWTVDPNLKLPYTEQWNLAVQQSLGTNQSLTLSYIGSEGHRLLRLASFPCLVSGYSGAGSPTLTYYEDNAAWSNYNAFQAQFQRRLSRGIQALLSYTWAHSLDTTSGDDVTGLPPNMINMQQSYGPSDFDVRHAVTGALTYDIPGIPSSSGVLQALTKGWGLDVRESFRTAFPINLTAATLFSQFGNKHFVNQANLVPGVPEVLYGSQYPGGQGLNPAAFVPAPKNLLGDFPRNSLRGFNATQTDVAFRRQFPLRGEKLKMQFRFEFFNIFNHPNFMDYGGAITTANYNVSTQTLANGLGGVSALYQMGGPRSGQVSVKFIF